MIKIMNVQTPKLIGYISIIMAILGLHSCEYESNNINFVRLEKPKKEIQFGIDLVGVNPTEVIYVNNYSAFYYSLFTDGKEVLLRQFYWDGVPIDTNQDTGEGYIDVDYIDNDIHELKLVIALKTGTESLAEYAGVEMYVGEYNFKVKVIDDTNNRSLNLREGVDNNGNLKIIWDRPTEYEVSGYKVYHGDKNWGSLLATITDPSQTYYIDTDYVYGYKNFTIVAEVKNSFDLNINEYINVSYTNFTNEQFEMKRYSKDKFLVKWNNPNPYPCKYVLTNNKNSDIIVAVNDGEWIPIPATPFPTFSNQFNLYLLPKDADTNNYESYTYITGLLSDKRLSFIDIAANKSEEVIHTLNFNSVDTYDVNTMKCVYSAKQTEAINTGAIIKNTPNGLLSYNISFGNILIFSDYRLENKVATFEADDRYYYPLSNNRILIPELAGFTIYDINNKDILLSKTWYTPDGFSTYSPKVDASPDGNYIYIQCTEQLPLGASNNWIEVYELTKNNELNLLSKRTLDDRLILYFNPNNDDEVIAQYPVYIDTKFVIKNIKTKSEKEIKGQFINIDPFTDNLIYRDEKYYENNKIIVLNKDHSLERLSIELSDNWSDGYVFNNYLFMYGMYVDLSTLKEWKQ